MQNINSIVRNIFSIQGIRLSLFLATQLTLSLPDIHVYVKVGFCLFALASLIAENPNVKNILPLLTFSATFAAISYVNGAIHSNFELLGMLLCPLTYYLMGCSVVRTSHSDNEILWIILLTIISSNLILWENIIADVSENGLINVSRIIATDDGSVLSATLQSMTASLGTACVVCAISYGVRKKAVFIISILAAALSLFCIIHLVTRTGLIVFAVVVFVALMYNYREQWWKILLTAVFVAVVFVLVAQLGGFYFDALDAYAERNEDSSIASGGLRTIIWKNALNDFVTHPFGWSNKVSYYAHNLWLDVARCAGILPFFILVAISVRNYQFTYRLFKMEGNPLVGFIVGLNVCMFLSAFMEPVLEGVSTYFYLMCMIWGIQRVYYEHVEDEYDEEGNDEDCE